MHKEMNHRDALMSLLSYNPHTGVFVWKRAPYNTNIRKGSIAGCSDRGYVTIKVFGTLHRAHRLAWLFEKGCWPSKHLDHINGQRDDNRICNLREATPAENQQNLSASRANTSGHIGVYLQKSSNNYIARIGLGNKQRYLGSYATQEEAAAAYLAAKKVLHTFQPVPRDKAND